MPEEIDELLKRPLSVNLKENKKIIEQILENSVDFVVREFIFHEKKDFQAVIFYTDGLVNTDHVSSIIETFLYQANKLIQNSDDTTLDGNFINQVEKHFVRNASVKDVKNFDEVIQGILSGDTILFINQAEKGLLFSTRGWNTRSVDEPQTEQVVRGPRDGFTESIRSNTTLVRRRIRDPLFRIEALQIGKKSRTDINIAYLKGTAKEELVEEVKKRLKSIKMDAVIESGYIEELIEDAPYSPFATIMSTERPDKVAAEILEGKVAIFVDNTPFVLILPAYFWQFLQASDDYYSRYMSGTFFRFIRYIAFVISLTLPSIYVMLASFHQEMIPTGLALTIASGREVVPFPVLIEALIMEISFELMREAGLRMPKPVGQAVSIVGSLVIGQAAVSAGIISPFMVIIVAITGIASFAIPNYAASFSIRLLRFPLLLASGTLGLLGFAAMLSIITIHALSLRSFGEPYMAPAAPFKPSDQKDTMIRMPWWKMMRQPELAEGIEDRVGEGQIPKPPPKDVGVEQKEMQDQQTKENSSIKSRRRVKKPKQLMRRGKNDS